MLKRFHFLHLVLSLVCCLTLGNSIFIPLPTNSIAPPPPFKRKVCTLNVDPIPTTRVISSPKFGNIYPTTYKSFNQQFSLVPSHYLLSSKTPSSNTPTVKMVHHSPNLVELEFDLDDPRYLLNSNFEICLIEGDRLVFPSNLLVDPC